MGLFRPVRIHLRVYISIACNRSAGPFVSMQMQMQMVKSIETLAAVILFGRTRSDKAADLLMIY